MDVQEQFFRDEMTLRIIDTLIEKHWGKFERPQDDLVPMAFEIANQFLTQVKRDLNKEKASKDAELADAVNDMLERYRMM